MKVIIQNIAGNGFLGSDGRWVPSKDGAKDFFTLVRAYNFAQAYTSVPFRVLLHCPEDGYSASIVEGIGNASAKSPAPVKVTAPVVVKHDSTPCFQRPAALPKGFNEQRMHLN